MSQTNTSSSKSLLFSPIGLVMVLTLITFGLSFGKIFGERANIFRGVSSTLEYWKSGFFSLLAFTLQMMMVLAFGYAIAIFQPINNTLRKLSSLPKSLPQATLLVAVITLSAGLLNWGFGLIIGALLARFVHESLVGREIKSNPELLAACGYLGMAIWHGGLSASSLLSIAEQNHGLQSQIGIIPITETIFSKENLLISLGLFLVFSSTSWALGRFSRQDFESVPLNVITSIPRGKSDYLASVIGFFLLLVLLFDLLFGSSEGLAAISLNWVIFFLFALALVFFKSWNNFLAAAKEGLKSSLDIFIQFPFYGGIMGVILGSGLLEDLAQWTASWANQSTFPLFTFYSAALVNFFIPSGGGQWAVQGPLIMKTSELLNLPYAKMSLAFAYGDQISNLLQPFWALPLLSITGVSVRRLLPYCLILFLVGIVFLSGMILIFF